MRKKSVLACALFASLGFSIEDSLATSQSVHINPNLDQGLSSAQINTWYNTSEGSRLIPLSWFYALEEKGSQRKFSDTVEEYGLLKTDVAGNPLPNPLPLGFAIDRSNDTNLTRTKLRWRQNQASNEPWVGVTCGGCHTSVISYENKKFVVPGGQSMFDLSALFEELHASVQETLNDESKFNRFAQSVLGQNSVTVSNKETLRAAFKKWNVLAVLVPWRFALCLWRDRLRAGSSGCDREDI